MQGTHPARHVQSTSHDRVGAPRFDTVSEAVAAQSGSFHHLVILNGRPA